MHVNLATQVLSEKVAVGIANMVRHKIEPMLPEAQTTANFIRRCDILFDSWHPSPGKETESVQGMFI